MTCCETIIRKIERLNISGSTDTFQIGASIGITQLKIPGDDVLTILARADQACYKAKQLGGNQIQFNNSSVDGEASRIEYYNIVRQFQVAQENSNIAMAVQKIVPLSDEENLPERYEILLRILDATQSVNIETIVNALERSRLSHRLDEYMIKNLIRLIENDVFKDKKYLNINVSPSSIDNWSIMRVYEVLLEVAQQKKMSLCFEITERTLLKNFDGFQKNIASLRDQGALFAIDDFGMGYASYGYLESIKVDMIKLDGSLVTRIEDPGVHKVINSIHSIAQSIGATTVAEHVENEKQTELLREIGISYAQSFYHSHPVLLEDKLINL